MLQLPGTLGLNFATKSSAAVAETSIFSSYWESRDPSSPGLKSLKQEDDPYVGFSIDAGDKHLTFPRSQELQYLCSSSASLLLLTASDFLFFAVYVVARALEKMRQNGNSLGNRNDLRNAIGSVSFQGVSGHIAFDTQLDPIESGLLPYYPFI